MYLTDVNIKSMTMISVNMKSKLFQFRAKCFAFNPPEKLFDMQRSEIQGLVRILCSLCSVFFPFLEQLNSS